MDPALYTNEFAQPDKLGWEQGKLLIGCFCFYAFVRHVVCPPLCRMSSTCASLKPYEQTQWVVRVVSNIHVAVCLYLSALAIRNVDTDYFGAATLVHANSPAFQIAIANTCAYLSGVSNRSPSKVDVSNSQVPGA